MFVVGPRCCCCCGSGRDGVLVRVKVAASLVEERRRGDCAGGMRCLPSELAWPSQTKGCVVGMVLRLWTPLGDLSESWRSGEAFIF